MRIRPEVQALLRRLSDYRQGQVPSRLTLLRRMPGFGALPRQSHSAAAPALRNLGRTELDPHI
jgi:transposase